MTMNENLEQNGGRNWLPVIIGAVLVLVIVGLVVALASRQPAEDVVVVVTATAENTPAGLEALAAGETEQATEEAATEEATEAVQVTEAPTVGLPTVTNAPTFTPTPTIDAEAGVAAAFAAAPGQGGGGHTPALAVITPTAETGTGIPIVQVPLVAAPSQSNGNGCPQDIDQSPVIDPTGQIFPSWNGISEATRADDWPSSYVQYLDGTEVQPTRENPLEVRVPVNTALVLSGDAVVITGDAELETFEAATAVSIYNGTSNPITVRITPKNTSTFGVQVFPVASVNDSLRAVTSFYAGSLLLDNQALQRVGFRIALITDQGQQTLEGVYVRNCGTITSLEEQSLIMEPTPVADAEWAEPFWLPAPVVEWPIVGELAVAETDQADANEGWNCDVLVDEPVQWVQCSATQAVDAEFELRPGVVFAGFANGAIITDQDNRTVFQNQGQPDLFAVYNDSNESWFVELDSSAPGYLVMAEPVFGEWTPESLWAYVNHLTVTSLRPDMLDERYWDTQTEEYSVPLATAVPPCEDASAGCQSLTVQILRWDGTQLYRYWDGVIYDDGTYRAR